VHGDGLFSLGSVAWLRAPARACASAACGATIVGTSHAFDRLNSAMTAASV